MEHITDAQQTENEVFEPAVISAPVVEATRGRQVFNDSDKDNYFEG